MGRFKQKMMDEESLFWGDCIDMMKESESMQEFWGRFNAAEKMVAFKDLNIFQ